MTDDVLKRMKCSKCQKEKQNVKKQNVKNVKKNEMSILSEVILAVVQRSERNEHTVSYIAIHTRGR